MVQDHSDNLQQGAIYKTNKYYILDGLNVKKARYIKDLSKQSVPKKECDKGSACFDKKIIRLGKGSRKYLGFGKVVAKNMPDKWQGYVC